MQKIWSEIHQSWFMVWLCIGIVIGVILGAVFRINYFASIAWIILALGLIILVYIKPKIVFITIALVAGMILAFVRVATELEKQNVMGDSYSVTAGIETEKWVTNTRDWFAERIEKLIPEKEVRLGLSYLLGMKAGLSDELSDNLRAVGLTHIVVASGAHLAILVEVTRKVFGKISRFAGVLFSGLFIIFFMSMVGWTPSILRAGIMAILTLIAWQVGRKFEPWRIILIVAAITLMINPMYITNLGWLLSFAAYGGIMILGSKWTKFFYGAKKPGFIGATIITTIAATVMTLPIILFYFGQVSLISVAANLLILPTLPWAMGLTFLTGVVAGLPGVETIVAWCAARLLDFHIAVVEFFGAQTPFLVEINRYQPLVFLIYTIIILPLVVGWLSKKWKSKKNVIELREGKY